MSTESPTLHALLESSLRLPPEYEDQLTSHLPMALHALEGLGASPARLHDFYAVYARRFVGMQAPDHAAPTPLWQALRGNSDAYPVLLATMQGWIAREGSHAVLSEVIPSLVDGVAAAGLHGAIRTAHAVQSGHLQELAAALAYWAWRWQPLKAVPAPGELLSLSTWASKLVEGARTWRTEGGLISIRMEEATQSAVYQSLASALRPAANLRGAITALAGLAIERYGVSPNFTVLHMVTGLRALRVLLPWLVDDLPTQAVVVRAFTAAYLAARVATLFDRPIPVLRTWSEIKAAAIQSNDDHVIKLVHACWDEAGVYGEAPYLHAAGLAVR